MSFWGFVGIAFLLFIVFVVCMSVYSCNVTPETLERWKKEMEPESKRLEIKRNGFINEKIVCPHCGEKGGVKTVQKERTEKHRLNSVGGAMGMGTNVKKKVTQMYCINCKMKWDV